MKRAEIKRRPLADTVLESLEPEGKEYRVSDGAHGLYFRVHPDGRKGWVVRYKSPTTDKWRWYSAGSYPETRASTARRIALKVRQDAVDGIDPIHQRQKENAKKKEDKAFTVKWLADKWYQFKLKGGRAQSTLEGYQFTLNNHVLPYIGHWPLTAVTNKHCTELQERVEAAGHFNSAKKLRGVLQDMFGLGVAKGWVPANPAADMYRAAQDVPDTDGYPHLEESELPEFLRALRGAPSRLIVSTAAWMSVYLGQRPGMIQQAEWREFDLGKRLWHIEAAKMKGRLDHTVTLPNQVVALLKNIHRVSGRGQYVFPSNGWKKPHLSDAAVNKCFSQLGYKGRMTGHGCRHTFQTIASEYGWPVDWSELHMAHVKPGQRKVYDRAKYLGGRRLMMQWYADLLDAMEQGTAKPDDFLQRAKHEMANYKVEPGK